MRGDVKLAVMAFLLGWICALFLAWAAIAEAQTTLPGANWECGDFDFNGRVSVTDTLKHLRRVTGVDGLTCGFCAKECMSCTDNGVMCGCLGEVSCNQDHVECTVTCNSQECSYVCN